MNIILLYLNLQNWSCFVYTGSLTVWHYFQCVFYSLEVNNTDEYTFYLSVFPVWAIALDQYESLSVFFSILGTSERNSPSQRKPNEPVRPQYVVLNRKTPVIRPMRGIFSEPLWNILYMTHRAQHLLHIAEWHRNRLKHSIL